MLESVCRSSLDRQLNVKLDFFQNFFLKIIENEGRILALKLPLFWNFSVMTKPHLTQLAAFALKLCKEKAGKQTLIQ